MERVQFFGSAMFIPIFLVSVGVLLDPEVLVDPKTLLVALVFTIAVLGGKSLAAVIAGRRFGFSWPEVGVMSGLSGSQAAATLATTLVGAKLGLFDKQTINAVLVVILASLIVTPAVVTFFARKMGHGEATARRDRERRARAGLGARGRGRCSSMAGRIAETDGGIVLATTLATDDAPESEVASRKRDLEGPGRRVAGQGGARVQDVLPGLALDPGGTPPGDPLRKCDDAPRRVALGSTQPHRDERRGPPHADSLDDPRRHWRRSPRALRAPRRRRPAREELVAPRRLDLDLASEIVIRLAPHRPVVVVATAATATPTLFASKKLHSHAVESADPLAWLKDNASASDLVVLPGIDAAHEALERIPWLSGGKFLVTIGAHAAPAAAREGARLAGEGLVVGRSLTEAAS